MQINNIKNIANNVLVIIFTKVYTANAELSEEYLMKYDESHYPIFTNLNVPVIKLSEFSAVIYDYKNAFYLAIVNELSIITVPQNIKLENDFDEFIVV